MLRRRVGGGDLRLELGGVLGERNELGAVKGPVVVCWLRPSPGEDIRVGAAHGQVFGAALPHGPLVIKLALDPVDEDGGPVTRARIPAAAHAGSAPFIVLLRALVSPPDSCPQVARCTAGLEWLGHRAGAPYGDASRIALMSARRSTRRGRMLRPMDGLSHRRSARGRTVSR